MGLPLFFLPKQTVGFTENYRDEEKTRFGVLRTFIELTFQ